MIQVENDFYHTTVNGKFFAAGNLQSVYDFISQCNEDEDESWLGEGDEQPKK
jgi:hypothetical protein